MRGGDNARQAGVHAVAIPEAQEIWHRRPDEMSPARLRCSAGLRVAHDYFAPMIFVDAVFTGDMPLVLLNDLIFPGRRLVITTARRNVRLPDQLFASIKKGLLNGEIYQDTGRPFRGRIIVPDRYNRMMRSLSRQLGVGAVLAHADVVRQIGAACGAEEQGETATAREAGSTSGLWMPRAGEERAQLTSDRFSGRRFGEPR